jgi:peptidoglycan/xylan/chitin deacetylase (PgdA/CDA1 family)
MTSGAVILMYHSVARDDEARFVEPGNHIAPRLFERQMAFLRQARRVVPLSRLVDDIAAGKSPPAGTVCITFDDGYRDNLTIAAPILDRYRLPATLFLATGFVERAENQWSDTLHRLPLATGLKKRLHRQLLDASQGERMRVLADFQVEEKPRLMLDWDEARRLCRGYPLFEIGGHTREHLDLTKHQVEARAQIEGCAADLRRELGVEPQHFSYPYGRSCAETRRAVIGAGWRCAVVTDAAPPRVGPATDRYAMPRVQAPRSVIGLAFKLGFS